MSDLHKELNELVELKERVADLLDIYITWDDGLLGGSPISRLVKRHSFMEALEEYMDAYIQLKVATLMDKLVERLLSKENDGEIQDPL